MLALEFPLCLETYQQLVNAYNQSHRFYHTKEHISAMLRHVDLISEKLERPFLVELAIWFHDAIYKPFSKTNERDSAQWLTDFMKSNNASKDFIDYSFQLIMATTHNGDLSENDEKYLVDIDLSIFGSSEEVYREYELNVRKEYRWIPWFLFKKNRRKLLESFSNTDFFYNTEYFRSKYEKTARKNLLMAIKRLK
ncbi:HD domain-containing protein [Pleionea sediminis]|uniref:HD domain-containing protein n=1 Tax=Pleionea sediminis TaxID=2569479 RepID=UPI0011856801|nr:hypothetical protein [Pleionea sediminis]